jgi:hypothetical protein
MVKDFSADTVPLVEFPYSWRVLDDRWDRLPDAVLKRIHPLSLKRGQLVAELGSVFRNPGPFHVNTSCYHATRHRSLKVNNSGSEEAIREWLGDLPLDPHEVVYASWGNNAAVVIDWQTFVSVWDSLWYPFDVLDVFDDSLGWGVLFGPEEFAVFVEPGSANPKASTFSDDAGYQLVQAWPP